VLEEAEGAAQQRAAELSAELQRLQVAHSDAQSEAAQQAGELAGLAAEVARRAAGAEASAAAATAQAAALSKAEHELEVVRAQLKAQSGGKGAKQQQDRRCAARQPSAAYSVVDLPPALLHHIMHLRHPSPVDLPPRPSCPPAPPLLQL
jgi:hypothetical protein